MDCLGQAGSNGLPQFENREKLLAELCHYFVIDKVRSALEQFKEGLANLNVLQLMRSHPNLLEWVFCHGQSPLTSSTMDGIFIPSYSEEGTRQRDREEMVIMHWRDFLQDCESKDSRNDSDIGNFVLYHAVIKSLQYSLDVILQYVCFRWEKLCNLRKHSSVCNRCK